MPQGDHNARVLTHIDFLDKLAQGYRPLKEARNATHNEPNGAFALERALIEYIRSMRDLAKAPKNAEGVLEFTDERLNVMDALRADFITLVDKTSRPGFLSSSYEKQVFDVVRDAVTQEQHRMQRDAQLSTRHSLK